MAIFWQLLSGKYDLQKNNGGFVLLALGIERQVKRTTDMFVDGCAMPNISLKIIWVCDFVISFIWKFWDALDLYLTLTLYWPNSKSETNGWLNIYLCLYQYHSVSDKGYLSFMFIQTHLDASAAKYFWKYCYKRRNSVKYAILLLPQYFYLNSIIIFSIVLFFLSPADLLCVGKGLPLRS